MSIEFPMGFLTRPTPNDDVVDLCETLDRERVIADGGPMLLLSL